MTKALAFTQNDSVRAGYSLSSKTIDPSEYGVLFTSGTHALLDRIGIPTKELPWMPAKWRPFLFVTESPVIVQCTAPRQLLCQYDMPCSVPIMNETNKTKASAAVGLPRNKSQLAKLLQACVIDEEEDLNVTDKESSDEESENEEESEPSDFSSSEEDEDIGEEDSDAGSVIL